MTACLFMVFAATALALAGKFLHVTDVHLDEWYLEGASAEAHCHWVEVGQRFAGPFGDRSCDTSMRLVEQVLEQAASKAKAVDFVLLTGDNARHSHDQRLRRTAKQTLRNNVHVRDLIAQSFPNVPIVYALGNNDIPRHKKPRRYMLRMYRIWRRFIPLDQHKTFLRGGYYHLSELALPLELIVLNTNLFESSCRRKESPASEQLVWLEKKLHDAAVRKVFVYIIGHIPPHHKYYKKACRRRLLQLFASYSTTIHVGLFGHTHADDFQVYSHKSKSSVVCLMAPSVMPTFNPAVRVVHYATSVDGNFGQLVDYDQYYVELDRANAQGRVELLLEYSASRVYGRGPLDAGYFARATEEIGRNATLRRLYQAYKRVSLPSQ